LAGWLAYVVCAAEAAGGLVLVLGIQARWVALALLPPLAGAIICVHGANGWVFTAPGGGWEYPPISSARAWPRPCSATVPSPSFPLPGSEAIRAPFDACA